MVQSKNHLWLDYSKKGKKRKINIDAAGPDLLLLPTDKANFIMYYENYITTKFDLLLLTQTDMENRH